MLFRSRESMGRPPSTTATSANDNGGAGGTLVGGGTELEGCPPYEALPQNTCSSLSFWFAYTVKAYIQFSLCITPPIHPKTHGNRWIAPGTERGLGRASLS